jgi:hypothetical protein
MPTRADLVLALGSLALGACHPSASAAPPVETEETLAVTSAAAAEGARGDRGADGVAVVELFTSEGCSSCPSADAVLGELARAHDPRVFPLAFQVDYWNGLGWPDRFSSAAWTDRQRDYAASFGTGSVYTPQMIVGGVDPFTGSDASRAKAAIARSLASGSSVRLSLTAEDAGPQAIVVRFHAEPRAEGAVVHVALAEAGLSTRVLAGENRGRTLSHENVVRAFATSSPGEGDGALRLDVPAGVDRGRAEVVGYVQLPAQAGHAGMPILAAGRAAVPRRP